MSAAIAPQHCRLHSMCGCCARDTAATSPALEPLLLLQGEVSVPIGPITYPGLSTGLFAANNSGKPARSLYRVLERRQDSTVVEVGRLYFDHYVAAAHARPCLLWGWSLRINWACCGQLLCHSSRSRIVPRCCCCSTVTQQPAAIRPVNSKYVRTTTRPQ